MCGAFTWRGLFRLPGGNAQRSTASASRCHYRRLLELARNVVIADTQIRGREAMEKLPEGHAIGFFDDQRLVHVMLSVGNSRAAGNKNDCIGIGEPIGWEALNLNHLTWNEDGCVTAPGLHQAERSLVVRSRLLGDAAT